MFKDLYDADRYARSQEYTRARIRFGFVVQFLELAGLVGFWFWGGFGVLERWLSPVTPALARGLLYVGCLAAAKDLLSIPFDLYSAFVIEERFGFNRTTLKTFVTDRLKGYGLAVVLGGPVLALVLWLFGRLGSAAWIWGWGAVTAFSLLVQFIAPTWILPLFNKFTPLPEGELRDAIFALARRLQFPLTNVFVMDGSRRSTFHARAGSGAGLTTGALTAVCRPSHSGLSVLMTKRMARPTVTVCAKISQSLRMGKYGAKK
jgi:STE24 endopeptidase